jgi:4-amino-4-deoxy-L-arabinose transferase-like glycosyltransferase
MSAMHRPYLRVLVSPLLIAAVAFAVRLAALHYTRNYEITAQHFIFAGETGRIARAIASGEGFSSPLTGHTGPTAWLPPVYPYLLGAVFRLFGIYSSTSAWVILTLNRLFSALSCLSIFAISNAAFNRTVAAVAGWTWAIYPSAIYHSVKTVWEPSLSALLFSLVFLVTLHLRCSSRLLHWAGLGLLWALTVLTNLTFLSLIPFFLAWLWFRNGRQDPRFGRLAGALVLALLLGVTPWLARNYVTFGRFVFIRSNFGLELFLGNNEDASGVLAFWLHPGRNEDEMTSYRRMGELAYMAKKQEEAFQFIMTHPERFLWASFKRFVFFWTGNWELNYYFWFPGRFAAAKFGLYILMSSLAFIGFFLTVKHSNRYAVPFMLVITFFPLIHYITYSSPRYRHPIEPMLVVLAVYAAMSYLLKRRSIVRRPT